MKISEMNFDQLQDYALKQEEKITTLESDLTAKEAERVELDNLNKTLQKRNNELFLQVEQKVVGDPKDDPNGKKEDETETCEEWARKYILGGK